MKVAIQSGKGGWVMRFEGEAEFHVFRGDEALRLVKILCKKALNVDLDTVIRSRQEEIDTTRTKVDLADKPNE